MGHCLVLGGARSGKSRFAEDLARRTGRSFVYVATAEAHDAEMAERIALHRQQRGTDWQIIEAPLALPQAIREAGECGDVVLVDCLTVWLSNLLLAGADCLAETTVLLEALAACRSSTVLVSNEVGLAMVPDNALARAFATEAGRLNRRIAATVGSVYFVVAGQPLRLK